MYEHDAGPRDLIGPTGLDAHALDLLDRATGSEVVLSEPGEVLLDPGGIPLGVGPTRNTPSLLARVILAEDDVTALGLTITEARTRWPNLQIQENHR